MKTVNPQDSSPSEHHETDKEVIDVTSSEIKKDIPLYTVPSSEDEHDNSSFLCSQHSDKEDSSKMRERSVRKLKKLVDKCCRKRIKFSTKYFDISKRLAAETDSVTDQEIYDLRSECLESLGTLNVSFSSSTSDSSLEKDNDPSRPKKLKRTKSLVHSSIYKRPDPYNLHYHVDPMYGYPPQQRPSPHRPSHPYREALGEQVHYTYGRSHDNTNYHPYRDNFYSRRQQRERAMGHYGEQYYSSPPPQYPPRSRMEVEISPPFQKHGQATGSRRVSQQEYESNRHSSEQNFSQYTSGTVSMEMDESDHGYCDIGPHIHGKHSSETSYPSVRQQHEQFSQRPAQESLGDYGKVSHEKQYNKESSIRVGERMPKTTHMSSEVSSEQSMPKAASDSNQSRTNSAFLVTGELPSFSVISNQHVSEVHLSSASTPRSDPDTSITPDLQLDGQVSLQ